MYILSNILNKSLMTSTSMHQASKNVFLNFFSDHKSIDAENNSATQNIITNIHMKN